MRKERSAKVTGIPVLAVSALLGAGLVAFAYFLSNRKQGLLGTTVLDSFLGVAAMVFSIVGVVGVARTHQDCLEITRSYSLVAIFVAIIGAVVHTVVPVYSEEIRGDYALQNGFYLAATAYILLILLNAYSAFATHSILKQLHRLNNSTTDLELLNGTKSKDLNDTAVGLSPSNMV